jgi:hypothetical protein
MAQHVSKCLIAALLCVNLASVAFSLQAVDLENGINQFGGDARILQALQRGLSSRLLHVVAIGGSITAGHSVGNNNWFSQFTTWLQHRLMPSGVNVTSANLGKHGATPFFAEMCTLAEMRTLQDPDIVFLELSVNDWNYFGSIDSPDRRAFERIVRRLLALPTCPAIVVMMFHPYSHVATSYFNTTEDRQLIISQYYGLTVLSGRAAFYATYHPGNWSSFFTKDGLHPNVFGHTAHSNLAKLYFLRKLQKLSFIKRNVSAGCHMLRPPLFSNNTAVPATSCVFNQQFKSVASAGGFTWVEDATRKRLSYTSQNPGSWLQFELPVSNLSGAHTVNVFVAYLTSYDSMGTALASCVGHCSCTMSRINAHQNMTRVSVPAFHSMSVHIPVPAVQAVCHIRIEVLSETTSFGHRFDIFGFAFSSGSVEEHILSWLNFAAANGIATSIKSAS